MRKFIMPSKLRQPKIITLAGASFPTGTRNNAAKFAGRITKKTGRGNPDIANLYLGKCSCSREKTVVFCRACGFFVKNSRVSLLCSEHPRVQFLHDLPACPRCHSAAFLDEVL